jgi:hypothetical protein
MTRANVGRRLLVFLLCLNATLASAYLNVTKVDYFDTALGGPKGDAVQYVRIYQGVSLHDVPRPFRYRILTPYLARLVPVLPTWITRGYEVSPDKIIKFKFAVVNMLGLAGAGLCTLMICEVLGFSAAECLVGSLLFMTGFAVGNTAVAPMTDALGYFFLGAAILCVLRGWHVGLFLTVLIGMLAKETTAYVLVPILTLKDTAAGRLRKALLCLPGILGYVYFRKVLFPGGWGFDYSLADSLDNLGHTLTSDKAWSWVVSNGGLAFGVLWAVGFVGWWLVVKTRDWGQPLFRLSALVPVAIGLPILVHAGYDRLWFMAYPAFIPLVLVALRRGFKASTG